jgi:hypothetical protein
MPHPVGPLLQLRTGSVSGRRYVAFKPKHFSHPLTQLRSGSVMGRRYGSFAGRHPHIPPVPPLPPAEFDYVKMGRASERFDARESARIKRQNEAIIALAIAAMTSGLLDD